MATNRARFDESDQPRAGVGRLPRSAHQLGCGTCGMPAQEHGRSVIHRFVRPDLPTGYCYLDELDIGDEPALHRRPAEQSTIVPTPPARGRGPENDGLLWLRTAHADLFLADRVSPGVRVAEA